jgi:hypothetical protein
VVVAGCGASTVPVKGIVRINGSQLDLGEKESIIVTWHWTDKQGVPRAMMAKTKHDGTFFVPGPKGRGLPPGDYKIAVKIDMLRDPEQTPEERLQAQEERLQGDFSAEKTPLTCTIAADGEHDLVIDLAAKTVKRR